VNVAGQAIGRANRAGALSALCYKERRFPWARRSLGEGGKPPKG